MPEGTTFFPFVKPEKLREGMTKWEQDQANEKTEQAKRSLLNQTLPRTNSANNVYCEP